MSNVKIGNNVIQNVTAVKLESADTAGQYVTFSEGGGTSEWEEIDLGGTGITWDVYAILDQSGDIMGASCSVTVGAQTKAQEGYGISRIHFKNVPLNTTVSYTGNGDDFHYAWAKLDTYVSVNSSSGAQAGSTTASNGHNTFGYLMLLISSPEM